MAIFTTATAVNLANDNLFAGLASIIAAKVTVLPDGFRLTLTPIAALKVVGSFTYTAGVPTAGTVTGIDYLSFGAAIQSLSGLSMTLATAISLATATPALVWSTALAGNDTITGSASNDILVDNAGSDVVDGGAGNDTLRYTGTAGAVVVTLNGATAAPVTIGGVAAGTISSIENITGGTGDDVLAGDGAKNILTGDQGNDTLKGGGGADVLDGGAGIDTVDFSDQTAQVELTLNGPFVAYAKIGGVFDDTVKSIENITGGSGNDLLTGDVLANTLSGGGGNDTLTGNAGLDILDGGAGIDTARYDGIKLAIAVVLNGATNASLTIGGIAEDTLRNVESIVAGSGADVLTGDAQANTFDAGQGDDWLAGMGGNDTLDGGAGIDTASYAEKTLAVAVTLNGATAASVTVNGVAEDTVKNIENLIGGSGADKFTGDAGANILTGGAGADTLDGGAGIDTARYTEKTGSVVVVLNGATAATVKVAGVSEDTVKNIENIEGGSGADTLTGDSLVNILSGGLGNDILAGLGAKDVLDGGGGSDTASYAEKTVSVVVTLNGASDAFAIVGGVVEDTLRGIESVTGGSAADTLTGDTGANTLVGGAGADRLKGGLGADTLDGGADIDTADYAGTASGVAIVLAGASNGSATIGGVAEDILRNIENVVGSAHNDSITGDTAANTFDGGAGDDLLIGGAGADVLDGGLGIDTASYAEKTTAVVVTIGPSITSTVTVGGVAEDSIRNIENLIGGSGDDVLKAAELGNRIRGGGGKDTLDGGGFSDRFGTDIADYSDKTVAVQVTLNGSTKVNVSVGGVVEDNIVNFEGVIGGSAGDTITGDKNSNVLFGGLGNDTLVGAYGIDTLNGGGGADVLDGGSDADLVDYQDRTETIVLTLSGATNATATIGGVAEDTLRNIENIFSGSGNDTLTGDTLANQLYGGGGDDLLAGRGGTDTIDGGAGIDTVSFSDATTAVVLTLNRFIAATAKIGGLASDTVRDVENVIGGSAGDTLTGDLLANRLEGGAGNDVLRGGAGLDVLDGGADVDTLDYADQTLGVAVVLADATFANVTLGGVIEDSVRNMENINSGGGADSLTGSALANVFNAGAGDDWLKGGGGNDTLDGGTGIDTGDYSDKTTAVAVTLNGATAASVTVGGVAEDTVKNIENVVGGSAGDTITGDAQANRLDGQAGNDTLVGSTGDDVLLGMAGLDVLDGGSGIDTVSYAEKTVSVVLTLTGGTNATAKVGGTNEDTVRNVENIIGGSAADTLTGDTLANRFTGGLGNDVLNGLGGSDTADYGEKTAAIVLALNGGTTVTMKVGGVSEDTLRNIENIIAGSGDDTITGDTLANTLSGGLGNDILQGGGGIDILDGGADTDTVMFADATQAVVLTLAGATVATATINGVANDKVSNFENATGGSGNDTLGGDAGINTLVGGAGDDTLTGFGGGDLLEGGLGSDTANYAEKTLAVSVTLNGASNALVRVGGLIEDTLRNVENVTGGSGNDIITGDMLANILAGGGGNDALSGGGGTDTLTGGAGLDAFLFNATALGAAASHTVTITDFSRAAGEVLNLAAIDANTLLAGVNAFSFIGTASFSNVAGQLRWSDLGADCRVEGDVNGNGVADLTILLTGVPGGIAADWFKLV